MGAGGAAYVGAADRKVQMRIKGSRLGLRVQPGLLTLTLTLWFRGWGWARWTYGDGDPVELQACWIMIWHDSWLAQSVMLMVAIDHHSCLSHHGG